jgi:hypothetical protein
MESIVLPLEWVYVVDAINRVFLLGGFGRCWKVTLQKCVKKFPCVTLSSELRRGARTSIGPSFARRQMWGGIGWGKCGILIFSKILFSDTVNTDYDYDFNQ